MPIAVRWFRTGTPGLEAAGKHGGEACFIQARAPGNGFSLWPINTPEKELQFSVIVRDKCSVSSTINLLLTFIIASTVVQSL